ncbi:PAS domain S-box protein [Candidatus Villigracilis saccharophilus]|uniref:sensor histidine kinase n=1 Tax=Candidatus Villigracilis saccharophilus TaxID=3140684 RepID=UPI0031347560|nr:PAS domain S-box protein [Anaerolineales bacterium]
MNDKKLPPFDDAALESLARKVEGNRADLIGRYQKALRETVFTNRAAMHPSQLAHIAAREADALISSLRHSLSSTKEQGAALSETGLSRQSFFGLLQAMREFFIAHFENDFTVLNIYTLYRIKAIEGYLESHEKRLLFEQDDIHRAFQIAINHSLAKTRESEERYRSLVEISPNAVMLLDLNADIIMMNKAGTELFKHETAQEVIGKNMASFIAPDQQAIAQNSFREMIETSIGCNREFLLVRKDGTFFDAELNGAVIVDANGKAQSIMLVGRDITLQKQTEHFLNERVMQAMAEQRRTSARLDELVTRSPTIIYAARLEGSYPTTFITENIYDQLGYPSEQIINDPDFLLNHIHPQDAERFSSEMEDVFKGQRLVLEYRVRHRNGEYRWMRDAVRLIRSPNGQPIEIIGSWIDITDRKHAEDALLIAEADYRAIFEKAPLGIFRSTVDGRFIKVNQAAAEMFGYDSPEEMIREIESIETQIYADKSKAAELQTLIAENSEVQNFISQDRRRNGSIFWTSTNARVVKNESGDILYYEGFIQDVTERKQMENALQQRKKELEINNIQQAERLSKLYEGDIERTEKRRLQLALDLHDVVLNQLAILRLNTDESHVTQNFQDAYDEVTSRLREIITDLRPPMLSYGLKPAIEGLSDNIMDQSKDTVDVVTDLQLEGEARYPEDIERHLFRIVQEASENALHHSHATQINILAKLTPEHIRLLVKDNGIGFPISGRIGMDDLLVNKHFGLVGMMERAMLIGAIVEITSLPNQGTQIQIEWNNIRRES